MVDVFAEALEGATCEYHERLVNAMDTGDTLIDFNYDCLADSTLARVAAPVGKFDPRHGYGYPVTAGSQYWGGLRQRVVSPILLLKPHGSLNWRIAPDPATRGTTLSLRADPYKGSAKGRIIPPIAAKDIQQVPFSTVWAACRDTLASTRALVVVGYSAPETDALAQALIRLHLGQRTSYGLASLVLVNPSVEVRQRWRQLCGRALRPARTRVHEFSNFRELANSLALP
jgi:hypothetical protein